MARKAVTKPVDKEDQPATTQKQSRPKAKGTSGSKAAKVARASQATTTSELTHEQIAQRANDIWKACGCPWGEPEKHWREAEQQLKQELGIK